MSEVQLSSNRDDWQTPQVVLRAVEKLGRIDFDPCSTKQNPVGATVFLTEAENGLKTPWMGGLIFVNPPYGAQVRKWAQKCTMEAARGNKEIVLLTAARPGTRWYQSALRTAAGVCFWSGRITFVGAEHPAPFDSSLMYWGPRWHYFAHVMSPFGLCMRVDD